MRHSDDSLRKKRPDYHDTLSSNKSKRNRSNQTRSSSGQGTNANIQWLYDYGPLKKSIAMVFAVVTLAGAIFFLRPEALNTKQKQEVQIELDAEARINIEKRVEGIKAERIAEELEKIVVGNQEVQPVFKSEKRNLDKGSPVYIWINKKGNKIYSNKKPIQEQNIPYYEIKP